MGRAVDALSVVLLFLAAFAFIVGLRCLGDHEDLRALYWLVVGSACLKGSVDLLRSGSPS